MKKLLLSTIVFTGLALESTSLSAKADTINLSGTYNNAHLEEGLVAADMNANNNSNYIDEIQAQSTTTTNIYNRNINVIGFNARGIDSLVNLGWGRYRAYISRDTLKSAIGVGAVIGGTYLPTKLLQVAAGVIGLTFPSQIKYGIWFDFLGSPWSIVTNGSSVIYYVGIQ